MSVPTLDELISPPTQAEIDQAQLDALELLGLPTDSWAEGGTTRTQVELQGETIVSLWAKVAQIARGGYGALAKGGWLDLWAKDTVELTRLPGTAALHRLVFTCAPGAGPITLTARQLWARDVTTGRRFVGPLAPTTVPDGATVTLVFQAEGVGTGYNLGPNRISQVLTPLPGLSLVSSLLDTQGTEVESDALFYQRCQDKRGASGLMMNDDGFRFVARQASTEVTRVTVREIDGDVWIYLAGPSGPCSGGTVATVDAALQAKRVRGVLYNTRAAASLPVVGVMAVHVSPGYGTIATTVEDVWRTYLGELEGGSLFERDEIVKRVANLPGVSAVPLGGFTSPSSDFTVPGATVPTLASLALSVTVTS